MGLPKFFVFVLLFAHCVFAEKLLKSTCDDKEGPEYIACSKDVIQEFFNKHSDGAPDKGIESVDPAVIKHFDVVEEALNLKSHFSNIKVTGFQDVTIVDLKEDETKAGSEYKFTLTLKFDFVAEGPVRIEFLKKDKSVTGDIKYEGGAIGVATYSYLIKKEGDNEVYELGPEEITSESQHAKSTPSNELQTAVDNVPDAAAVKEQYEKIKAEHDAKVVREIAKAVIKIAVENLRVLGRKPNLEKS